MKENNSSNVAQEVTTTNDANAIKTAGRPVDPTSKRQANLVMVALKAKAGISIKRGRPTDLTSERQKVLADKQSKIDNGITVKPGRPAYSEEQKIVAAQQKALRDAELQVRIDQLIANHPELIEAIQNGETPDLPLDELIAA